MESRIALSGSAGTGKTSLASRLAASLALPLSEDPVRRVLAEQRYRDLDAVARAALAEEVLRLRVDGEADLTSFVADGSTVELASFWLRWVTPDLADGARSRQFLDRCRAHAARYTWLVILPFAGIPLAGDGFRTADADYQYGMHCLGKGLAADWGLPIFELPAAAKTLEERVDRCRKLAG
jgi:predicted ATPase